MRERAELKQYHQVCDVLFKVTHLRELLGVAHLPLTELWLGSEVS